MSGGLRFTVGFVGLVAFGACLLTFLIGAAFALYGIAALILGEFHGREIGVFYLAFGAPVAWVSYLGLRWGWRSMRSAAQQGAPADVARPAGERRG